MLSIIIAAFVAVASASVAHDGACPDLKPVPNFNLTAFQGLWYEISKYPAEDELGEGKCGTAEYTLNGDVLKVKNSHVAKGVQHYVEGTAKLAEDANKAGKLVLTNKYGDVVISIPLIVLLTDYSNYAVVYNCKYDEQKKTHATNAWILSRTKKLEGEAKTAVENFTKANAKEFEIAKMIPNDFSDEACKFTSSSVVTLRPPTTKS